MLETVVHSSIPSIKTVFLLAQIKLFSLDYYTKYSSFLFSKIEFVFKFYKNKK